MDQIYALIDPHTSAVRYIGKARDANARLNGHLRDRSRRSTPLYVWMRTLDCAPEMAVLAESWDWASTERTLIAQYRADGADLLNVAAGGNQPHCPVSVRRENGRKNASAIHSDPFNRRVWELNRMVGQRLRSGGFTDYQRSKIRLAAVKRPDLFGRWATL